MPLGDVNFYRFLMVERIFDQVKFDGLNEGKLSFCPQRVRREDKGRLLIFFV